LNDRRPLLLLVPVALLALGLYVRTLAEGAFAAFTDYETPFAFPAVPLPRAKPLTSNVALVLVDGLGLGPSREMRALNDLRPQGADYQARIGLPSLSQPGRAVLLSGAWQEIHGQATNFKPRPLKVEHVFSNVRRAGGTTALSGMGIGVHKLFSPHVGKLVAWDDPPETAPLEVYEATFRKMADGARRLFAERPTFGMAELVVVDEAGHNWGAASTEYGQAVAFVDEELGRIAQQLDLSRTTLVVTADHGHVPQGGHGGPEPGVMDVPLVLVGAGIRPGAAGTCTQADVASTLAVLLGIDVPAANQGRPLLDALALDAAGRVDALRRVYAQRRAFVKRYVAWVSGQDAARLEGADAAARGGEADLRKALDELDAVADRAGADRQALEARVRSRLSLALVALPLVVAGLLVLSRAAATRQVLAGLAWGLAGVALYHLLLPVLGLGYSFSAVNKDEALGRFFLKDMVAGGACCALLVALAAVVHGRRVFSGGWDAARVAWLVCGGFCSVLVLKIAFVYWRHGVFLDWHMPDMYWGFGFYLDALALMAAAFLSPLLPLVATLALRLAPRPPLTDSARAA
jgi:hypothetical protein